MESAITWALEDKLGYWIRSFSREQLSLRGRTAQLRNVEIDGDALHAGLGLPRSLVVAAARIQELAITLPSILKMQVEPTVVNIDRLDIVLEEKGKIQSHSSPDSNLPSPSSSKDRGHGYADKIADGMTVKVGLLALLSFITSLCVALSRRVADPEQKHPEAARSFSASIMVDHIHLCIKDTELQLELLMKSLFFSRAAIRNLHLGGKHSGQTKLNITEKASQETEYPFECFTARVEGLQAIRPHLRNPATRNGTTQGKKAGSALASSDHQGADVEATMVTSQDNNGVSKWTVDKTRFSVEDLVTGAAATKEEQEYLSTICRSEADSFGRIAALVLRSLELDGSLGQAAIDQLATLGSGLDRIFTQEKSSTK